MRELDSSTLVSPGRWEGGRSQRARHMRVLASGTEMSPCSRGYRNTARDAPARRHDVLVDPGMEERFGSPARRRMLPSPPAPGEGRRALGWGRKKRTAARHRARFPTIPPARPSLSFSSSIAERASSIERRTLALAAWMLSASAGARERVSAVMEAPHHFPSRPHPHHSLSVPRPKAVSLSARWPLTVRRDWPAAVMPAPSALGTPSDCRTCRLSGCL